MIKAIDKRTHFQSIKADCLFVYNVELSSFLDFYVSKCLYKTNEYSVCKTEGLKTNNILLLNNGSNFSSIQSTIREAVLSAIDYGFYSIAIILNKNIVYDEIDFLSEGLKKLNDKEDIEIKLYTNCYSSHAIKEPRLRKLESNRFDLALQPASIDDVVEHKQSFNFVVPSTVKPNKKDSSSLQYQSLLELIKAAESLYKTIEDIMKAKQLSRTMVQDAANITKQNFSKNILKCQDDKITQKLSVKILQSVYALVLDSIMTNHWLS